VEVSRGEFLRDKKGRLTPVINIEEGRRYWVRKITISGAKLFSEAELLEFVRGLEWKYFHQPDLKDALAEIYEKYGDEGYIESQMTPRTTKLDKENLTVDINIDIQEGQKYYVGKIDLVREPYPEYEEMGWLEKWYRKNIRPQTKNATILREMRLKPGEVYRHSDDR